MITGTALAGIALATPLSRLLARQADTPGRIAPTPYGPLAPAIDATTGLPLLRLPPGFSYASLGWTGDLMSDGTPTPPRHDGMAVVARKGENDFILVRNHEVGIGIPLGTDRTPRYDDFSLPGLVSGLGGGTTTLRVRNGQLVASHASLSGTTTNCAGGPTPWGSWLSCEERTVHGPLLGVKDHGYVFEVPGEGEASARPIRDMGRMDHEAVAVDAATGAVYLTEDNGDTSGFYRFLPCDTTPAVGALEKGGRLEMLKVRDVENADLRQAEAGAEFTVEWVPIDDPDALPESLVPALEGLLPTNGEGRSGPYLQGEALGAARFNRGEGCWAHEGVIYFVDTAGGAASKGAVWAYHPGASRLACLYASPSEVEADNPDNLTVRPGGGLLLCEDGGGEVMTDGRRRGTRLLGLGADGVVFAFAENNLLLEEGVTGRPLVEAGDHRGEEFAGACFDPSGRTLFVNIQTPGLTLAITGPWERGPI